MLDIGIGPSVWGRTEIQRAVDLLDRLASSPAGIFTAGLGYLQTPANLLTYSQDFTNAAWVNNNDVITAGQTDPTGGASASRHVVTAGSIYETVAVTASTTYTFAIYAKDNGSADLKYAVYDNIGAAFIVPVTTYLANVTAGWAVVPVTFTTPVGCTSIRVYPISATAANVLLYRAGLFAGTYTASQLLALGGIPWTMGTASVALSLGPNKLTNGDFSSATGWTQEAGWSISGGVATATAVTGTSVYQTGIVTAGLTYQATITVSSITSGNVRVYLGNTSPQALITSAGTYTFVGVASGNALFYVQGGTSFSGVIDSTVVQEVSSVACPVYTDAHVYQAGSTQVSYGQELVTNGDFADGTTGWSAAAAVSNIGGATISSSSGGMRVTNDATGVNYGLGSQSFTTVVGATYQVALTRNTTSGGTANWHVGIAGNGPNVNSILANQVGSSAFFVATATTTFINLGAVQNVASSWAEWDNISVREKITQSAAINSLLSNNYILSDGSTGYSAVDGPVGLVLDGAGSVGSELVTNGTNLVNTTGWTASVGVWTGTLSAVSGSLRTIAAGTSSGWGGGEFVLTGLTVGATYVLNGSFVGQGGWTSFSTAVLSVLNAGVDAITPSTLAAAGTFLPKYFVAPASTLSVRCRVEGVPNGAASYADFGSISVKQVTGIHATQATTANKPTERRGLLNLLTYSQDFTNAAWTKAGAGAITYDQVGPTGVANTAATITTTTATLRAILGSVVAGTTGAPLTAAYFFKKTTGGLARYPTIAIEEIGISRLLGAATVDTSNGTVTNWTAYTAFTINSGYTSSISSVGDYWLVTVSGFASGATNCSLEIYPTGSATATQSSGTFTGAVGPNIVVGICGLFQGTLTAAQILDSGGIPLTTAAAASNATAGRYSWSFDGGDSLALGSVPFQTSDDHAVIAAYRTNSVGGANAAVAVLSATTGITRNCGIITETGTGKALVTWFDGVTNNQIATAASILGTPVVVSGRKVGASGVGRLNGTQFGTVTVAASLVGTVGFIGSFAGAGQEHNGNISIVIAVKGTLSDADMLTLERFAASTLPNAPSF